MATRLAVAVAAALAAVSLVAESRDTTNLSSTLSPDVGEWVRGLRNKGSNVQCCDDADGVDPVWDTLGTGETPYRVRYGGRWFGVSRDALITEKNRLGVARAWMGRDAVGNPYVRCFLPGPTS